jgi:hypothetical protein
MNSKTSTLIVNAPKETVFTYLSDIKNLPKWATIFWKELKVDNGKNKIITPMGELFFEISSDRNTGVIDMFAGPTERQMDIFPVRVLEMPGGDSIIIFTMFQTPGINDEQIQIQYESLLKEFENLKKEFNVACL